MPKTGILNLYSSTSPGSSQAIVISYSGGATPLSKTIVTVPVGYVSTACWSQRNMSFAAISAGVQSIPPSMQALSAPPAV